MSRAVVQDPSGYEIPREQRRLLRWTLYIGYFALGAGVAHGLAQALSYAGIDILQYFPALRSYYQGLTAHGVANALFFTFSFGNAFLPLLTSRRRRSDQEQGEDESRGAGRAARMSYAGGSNLAR